MSSKSACTAEFFVIRLPRLSINNIANLPHTDQAVFDFLDSWLASPGITEAIYLASPSLVERLALWREKPDSKSGTKVTTALIKYLIRMSARPTPFGLFSGVTKGELAEQTKLTPAPLLQDRRKTRLDMFYLGTIAQQWTVSSQGQQLLKYRPNSTLYRLGSHLHYIEPYQSTAQRQYRLSTLELDEALQLMLDLAQSGVTQADLIRQFCAHYPQAEPESVLSYVQELVKEQVLTADLKLPLTSGQPDLAFSQSLLAAGAIEEAAHLQSVLKQLADFDQHGALPEQYKAIHQQLRQLPYEVSENKLFQADLNRTMVAAQLDKTILEKIERTLCVLKVMALAVENPFQDFIDKFQQRFEGRFMPLMQLLDEEAGISFSADAGYETPLLAGVNIKAQQRGKKPLQQNALEPHLLQAMQQNSDVAVIQLSSDELLKNIDTQTLWQQLPASFAVNISCFRDADAKLLVQWHGCSGPSGATLLGRFCHLNEALQDQVRNYLKAEEALSPDVIFAEVVHMPDGRPGNVIARPPLRHYEIVFLADTLLPDEQQISVQDLYVFIEAGQVKLWSKRLNKQIVPRLTSAHNYSSRSLGVYSFLCMLQQQQAQNSYFSPPAAYLRMERQPRIQLDDVILQEAQWHVDRALMQALVVDGQWQATAWQALQAKYKLQRFVCYAQGDNVLTIDLHNPVMVNVLLAETVNQQQFMLKESLAMQLQSEVFSEQGNFAHEIVVPMLNAGAKPFITVHNDPSKQLNTTIQREFAPGSPWLSMKIYAAQSTAELVLVDVLMPLLKQCQQQGLFKQWFFIRYGDPGWHLRLRLLGEPAVLYGQVLPLIQQHLAPWLDSHRVYKVELFTYQREVERYGGDAAMLFVEQLFQADSELVLSSMALLQQYGDSVRWRMALMGVDALLDAFDYDLVQKQSLISDLRERFGQEFQEHAHLRNQLGKKYREYQEQLRHDFQAQTAGSEEQQPLQQMLILRQQFVQKATPLARQIFALQQQGALSCSVDILLHSLLHMFNNRIFKTYGREQEFVVYDFLRRFYLSIQSQHNKKP